MASCDHLSPSLCHTFTKVPWFSAQPLQLSSKSPGIIRIQCCASNELGWSPKSRLRTLKTSQLDSIAFCFFRHKEPSTELHTKLRDCCDQRQCAVHLITFPLPAATASDRRRKQSNSNKTSTATIPQSPRLDNGGDHSALRQLGTLWLLLPHKNTFSIITRSPATYLHNLPLYANIII